MQTIYKRAGKAIRRRRVATEQSIAKLAKASGMSRGNLNNIELGWQRIQLHQLPSLCKGLNLTVVEFVNSITQSKTNERTSNGRSRKRTSDTGSRA